jgi:putative MATE family efflux protein
MAGMSEDDAAPHPSTDAAVSLNRRILRLAVPALGALVAEPLFLLTDTALVGHLGPAPLAGLGIASTVLQTAVGLLVFLAYATTPLVARRLGAGDRPGAIRAGIDGMWLALGLGVVLAVIGVAVARAVPDLFAGTAVVHREAATYLVIAVLGLPGMLLSIAATGLVRGLQDTRTPLLVAVVGFAVNAGLNALLIYGAGLGIAGSALGTTITQWGMAAVYVAIAVRAAGRAGVGIRPGAAGIRAAGTSGSWLLLRTAALRGGFVLTIVVGAALGTTSLAALQVALTVLSTLAFALDALAIAAQAMVGHGLGAGDRMHVRALTRRLVWMGLLSGAVLGAATAALAGIAGPVFTADAAVRAVVPAALLIVAASAPLGGFVWVLDGVLIGAGDGRYLAWTGGLDAAAYAALVALFAHASGRAGLIELLALFCFGYLGARALTLGLRAAGTRWLHAEPR